MKCVPALMLALLVFPALTYAAPLRSDVAERGDSGKIKRSAAVKYEFRKSNPCPATGQSRGVCPGYEIDHIVPLKHGGADARDNMQWLTVPDHKNKTKQD
jgi:5-methylcytosine-specific restriction endonuclease McrA